MLVSSVYIACAPPQNPFLSQPLDTRTTRERSFKDLTGVIAALRVCVMPLSARGQHV